MSALKESNIKNDTIHFESVLQVQSLSIGFTQYEAGLRQRKLQVIRDLTVDVKRGEILAIAGSSGSGKSLLAHAVLGILPKNAKITGSIYYKGELLTPKRQQKLRGHEITLVPQSVNYLDPLMKVGPQVRTGVLGGKAVDIQRKLFKRYGLDETVQDLFPFQLSGGMARRVLIANAVVHNARLIIADEPTPGLHPEIVKETMDHLRELANQGCGVMLITHDIQMALKVADRIAVFYAGTTLETAPVENFKDKGQDLRHPYTKALWQALPQNEFKPLAGYQPSPNAGLTGCLFEPRCQCKTAICKTKQPEMRQLRSGNVRCYHAT